MEPNWLVGGSRTFLRRCCSPALVVALTMVLGGCATLDRITSDPIPPPRTSIAPPPLPSATSAPRPSPGAASVPTAPAPAAGGYRMGIGDKIRINVHGEPDLTMELTLSESGVINYPFLGDIRVRGKTVNELQQTIDRGLRGDYLVNPDVRVVVVAYRNFYINGEVRLPGGYPFVPGLTIRQAATLAGGFTERASMRGISVFRETDSLTKAPANLDTPVFPGDTVVVEQGLF